MRGLFVRYVLSALLIMLLASACSSGSAKKGTPSAVASTTAVLEGSTTPGAKPSVAPNLERSPTPRVGTPIAIGTVVTTAAAGVDPAVVKELDDVVRREIDALNVGKLDELYNLYSSCAKKKVTKDQLAFGKSATGTVTLLGIDVLSADDRAALVQIETRTLIFVGNQNHFRSKTNFIREGGGWKIDAANPAECGR